MARGRGREITASIINLRLATEQGADIDAHIATAKVVGIPYYHIPFSGDPPLSIYLYRAHLRHMSRSEPTGAEKALVLRAQAGDSRAVAEIVRAILAGHLRKDSLIVKSSDGPVSAFPTARPPRPPPDRRLPSSTKTLRIGGPTATRRHLFSTADPRARRVRRCGRRRG